MVGYRLLWQCQLNFSPALPPSLCVPAAYLRTAEEALTSSTITLPLRPSHSLCQPPGWPFHAMSAVAASVNFGTLAYPPVRCFITPCEVGVGDRLFPRWLPWVSESGTFALGSSGTLLVGF